MKKLLLFFLVCMSSASSVFAQKLLSVEETTEGIGVYPCGDRHEALVVFVCREEFELAFTSNYDQELTIERDSVAGTKSYRIVFVTQAPGVDYSGRRLTIKAPGFKDYTLPLNLKDKQKFEYTVSDPYSALRSPFFLYQEKGNDKFYVGEYQGARDYFKMVRACPEYIENSENKQQIDEHIALCDSMISWGAIAEDCMHFARYQEAYKYYSKMSFVNSSNKDLRAKLAECVSKYQSDCNAEFTLAEHYMQLNDLDRAKECYERVIAKECVNKDQAAIELANVRKAIRSRETHASALFYDYADNLPIGLTYATCHEDRHGAYITLRTNKSLIDMFAKKTFIEGSFPKTPTDNDLKSDSFIKEYAASFTPSDDYELDDAGKYIPKELDFEAQLSIGWVFHVWKPIFIHFTPFSYRGGGFYAYDSGVMSAAISDYLNEREHTEQDLIGKSYDNWSKELKHNASDVKWYNSIAPEMGLILKKWRLCAKVTYQYSYWLGVDDEYQPLFDDNIHRVSFGLGFCW